MNKALLMVAAAGLAGTVAVSALAQPAPPQPPPPQAQPGGPPPPPPGPGPQARGPMPPGFPPGEGPGMHGPPGPRGWRHGPPSRAAAFHVERGDISIGVHCAEQETMRACVDAAIALMEKANTMTVP